MKLTTLLAGAMALGLSTPVLADAHDPVKVGFIYVGPIGDGGWTYQHDQGRLAVEAEYGDKVETVFQESVPEGADAERAITQMALGGADIIFTTSFGYGEATNAVAAKFPDVKFEHATGFMREYPNVSTYDARFYEGRAVTGTLAGYLTETNKIGYIGSFPIPEVIQGINASYLHAKKINPDVEMVVTWAYTWFDPAKEADAARAMIDQGVDVILQHTDSTAPQAAAQEANENGGRVFTFGQASTWHSSNRARGSHPSSTTGPPTTSNVWVPSLTAHGSSRHPGAACPKARSSSVRSPMRCPPRRRPPQKR